MLVIIKIKPIMKNQRYFGLIFLITTLFISGISGYTVVGNKINDPNGKQVLLRGVDRPSLEWSQTGEQLSLSDYTLMAGWGSNVVRLATNQDFWLASTAYAQTIDQQITWITQVGMGVILDLHWNNGGQQMMADRNSITFWTQVATRYKDNAWVIFELYNEPHDVTWTQWLNGDSQWAGMQEMYDAVRAAGANNMVLVGGLNWAFDLSGVGNGFAVQGTNIAYATHPYDYAGKQTADWPAAFGYLVPTSPVVMTEFGQYCNADTYVSDLLAYAQQNQIHWSAWAWYVNGCSFPSIIADWTGTPITGVGELVKSYLSGNPPSTSNTSPNTAAPSNPSTAAPSNPAPTSAPSTSAPSTAAPASSAMNVFTDSLLSPWQDWSWATSYSLSDTTFVHSGTAAIKFQVMSFQGLYFHTTSPFASGTYNSVQFFVNGGTAAMSASNLNVKIYGTSAAQIGNTVPFPASAPASQWSLITIPMSSFGVSASTQISGLVIQSTVDASAGNIWIDDISFQPSGK